MVSLQYTIAVYLKGHGLKEHGISYLQFWSQALGATIGEKFENKFASLSKKGNEKEKQKKKQKGNCKAFSLHANPKNLKIYAEEKVCVQ